MFLITFEFTSRKQSSKKKRKKSIRPCKIPDILLLAKLGTYDLLQNIFGKVNGKVKTLNEVGLDQKILISVFA